MSEWILTIMAGVLLVEGLLPLLAPRQWQQWLRELANVPPEVVRRIGGCLVVSGGILLWLLHK